MSDQPRSLLTAVEVMDRLRSPDGCPWDAEQTHRSLAPYLLEETYEVLEAIDAGEDAALREELGDLLLQVLFHARLAEEDAGWSIEEVAAGLVEKLQRRHPHVFGDVIVAGVSDVNENWEKIKRAEKNRESITDGVPVALPALALAAKLLTRASRADLDVAVDGDDIGTELFALARRAVAAGVDPEQALRETTLRYRNALRAAEGVGHTHAHDHPR